MNDDVLPAVAFQVMRSLSLHVGGIQARLAFAFESAHKWVTPPQHQPYLTVLAASEHTNLAGWAQRLLDDRAVFAGSWALYLGRFSDETLQSLADDLFSSALAVLGSRDVEGALALPQPKRKPDSVIGDWAPYPPEDSPTLRRPDWVVTTGYEGYSLRPRAWPVPDTYLPRGRRLMRALQHQIRLAFEATALPEDVFALQVWNALMLVQALNEHVNKAYPRSVGDQINSSTYEAALLGSHEGRVVGGLKFLRNAEGHDPLSLLSFGAARVVSAFYDDGSQGYRSTPTWARYQDLPATVQSNPRRQDLKVAYETDVAGGDVIDTLQDALKFFIECDARMAFLTPDGLPIELPLEGFPLPVGRAHGYERPHPYWLSREETENQIRESVMAAKPGGQYRIIEGGLFVDGEVVAICGHTVAQHGVTRFMFTETPSLVARDIAEHSYTYQLVDETLVQVGSDNALRNEAGGELDLVPVEEEPKWKRFHDMCVDSIEYYKRQRLTDS